MAFTSHSLWSRSRFCRNFQSNVVNFLPPLRWSQAFDFVATRRAVEDVFVQNVHMGWYDGVQVEKVTSFVRFDHFVERFDDEPCGFLDAVVGVAEFDFLVAHAPVAVGYDFALIWLAMHNERLTSQSQLIHKSCRREFPRTNWCHVAEWIRGLSDPPSVCASCRSPNFQFLINLSKFQRHRRAWWVCGCCVAGS